MVRTLAQKKQVASEVGPSDVARSRALLHDAAAAARWDLGPVRPSPARAPWSPPATLRTPQVPAESGADGHPADCLHLRAELPVDDYSAYSAYSYFEVVTICDLIIILAFCLVHLFRFYRLLTCISWPLSIFGFVATFL
ncbi:hypothetical protein P7K49_016588 [Saguinus oedipus]|uniref:Uncharacterized protein n=1 Tax=Saguinus oedipus TaxID=9490 RepID=A0ABQ9VCI8_SAGOE|nr:hypothetical protein P7K49_016588 [Saguinus oedipus]